MSGVQVTMSLQLLCRVMVAAQAGENVTLPSIRNSTLNFAETINLPVLPPGYVAFPEIGFAYKISDTFLSYDEARKKCLKDDGQLAVIDSREKIEKILNHFSSFELAWVGLGRGNFYDTKEWITIDGKSTNNLPWASGEPSGDNRCVHLSKTLNGLRNWNCNWESFCFCEIALPRN